MKCPKCDYLGFESGDRCRNCGYDFSLIPDPEPIVDPAADLLIRSERAAAGISTPGSVEALVDLPLGPPQPPSAFRGTPLPLFAREMDSDEPLVTVPARPRPPLAVRRTPDTPRARPVTRTPAPRPEPALEFADQRTVHAEMHRAAPPVQTVHDIGTRAGAGRRLQALAIDYALLVGIDASVLYFTLRVASMPMAQWRVIPAAPMLTFLGMIVFGYFAAFTALGGQTIGKMAMGIRVVDGADGPVDAATALRRTAAALISTAPFGLGYLPALLRTDRLALHDRLAHTRVVTSTSA